MTRPAIEVLPILDGLSRRFSRPLYWLFGLTCLCGYLNPFPLKFHSEMQPWPLFGGGLVFFSLLARRSLPPASVNLLLIATGFASLYFAAGGWTLLGIRGFYNYVALYLIVVSSWAWIREYEGDFLRFLMVALFAFVGVALLQATILPGFSGAWLSRSDTARLTVRGVCSLFSEPSYFGLALLLLLGALHVLRPRNRWFAVVSVGAILFLSRAPIAVLFLAFYLVCLGFSKHPRAALCLLSLTGVALFLLTIGGYGYHFVPDDPGDDGLRLTRFFKMLVSDPVGQLTSDVSTNQRLSHIFLSLHGFWDGFPGGQGFAAFSKFYSLHVSEWRPFIFVFFPMDRVMSGYGSALFELGLAGTLVPISFLWCARSGSPADRRARLPQFLLLLTLPWMALPLAFPWLGILVGALAGHRPKNLG
ncbi:MAG: hypothetical protein J0L75_14060 [Spirochaetes bacterium]|nr:hypothetical protein [Spirochaetota bacterium]